MALALVACGSNTPPPAPAPPPDDHGSSFFQAFVEDYFRSLFEFSPTLATGHGFHEYDTRLERMTADSFRSRIVSLKEFARQIERVRNRRITPSEMIDASILEGQIRAELLDLEVLQTWRKNPIPYVSLPGAAVDSLMKRDFAPKSERLRSVIARLKLIPPVLEALRENVQAPPKEFTELAIRVAGGSSGFFRDSVPSWARDAAGSDAKLLQEFTAANAAAQKAMETAAAYLRNDLLPKSTGAFAIGATNFSSKLYYEEMVEVSLDRVLAIGEANLEKDYRAFVETAKKIDPGKTPAQVMTMLSDNYPPEANLVSSADAVLESIRKFVVDKKIITIPGESRPTLTHTPPYARSGSFASMDTPGAYEPKAKEAFYYITPPEHEWTPKHKEEHLRQYARPVMDIISIHETYPGHFVQFLYARQFPTKVRKLISVGTNAEGWAHYAEQMMIEQGYGQNDPKVKLAQLVEALIRDCRYVVGIKLHTQGMTVDQGAKVFEEKAFMEPANAYEEARRGAYNPTYLYYTLGKLQIYKLRADYERSRGQAKFSLLEFHDVFIKQGAIPLKLVRQILLPGDRGATL